MKMMFFDEMVSLLVTIPYSLHLHKYNFKCKHIFLTKSRGAFVEVQSITNFILKRQHLKWIPLTVIQTMGIPPPSKKKQSKMESSGAFGKQVNRGVSNLLSKTTYMCFSNNVLLCLWRNKNEVPCSRESQRVVKWD